MLHNKGDCFENADFGNIKEFFEARGEQGRATSTLSNDESAIKGAVEYMFLENGSDEHSSLLTRLERVRDLTQYGSGTRFRREGLTPEEAELLISSCGDFRDYLMMICAVELGPRSEALRMIKMDSIDLENKEIELNNTKTGGTYVMPLRNELADLLRHWIDDVRPSYISDENNQFLFPSREGGMIGKHRFNEIVDEHAQEAGIQEVIAQIPDGKGSISSPSNSENFREKKKVDVHNLRHTLKNLLDRDELSKDAKKYALDHARDVTDEYGSDNPEPFREEIREKFGGIDLSDI
jgi:integrase/recombinase XerD